MALTYNVAGLPEILSRSRPSEYTPLIGQRLNGYDLVLLQETWQTPEPNPVAPLRCYHELLLTTAAHPYKSPSAPQPFGDDPHRPSALLADGLNVFSRLPLEGTLRMPWATCVDTFNDCEALKGFSLTPMKLARDLTVHVYNLHMEAGWSAADDEARAIAIDQLLAFIDLHSRGEALIVGGDFNLRDRARAAELLGKLRERAGLRDACERCERPNNVDKVLYRGSALVELNADAWRLESDVFKAADGEPLSDHAPLAVGFTWSKRASAGAASLPPSPLPSPRP
jgi:endonuclease/exonuclease/phosphatase family metal-dependent hydrolase